MKARKTAYGPLFKKLKKISRLFGKKLATRNS